MSANSRMTVAVHALTLLAEPGGKWCASDWIAASVNTHPVVVRRTLAALQAAGLVEGQAGAKGGYRLAIPGRRVTLADVYRAMRDEGPFGLHAHAPNPQCPVGRAIQKHLTRVYDAAETALEGSLRATTVAALRGRITAG
ncbi:MAG: Rrf2 family transcriptional regulator [Thermoanaerobaculia bacterium]